MIMAITGHKSLSEVQNYTKAAKQKRLARQAMAMLRADQEQKMLRADQEQKLSNLKTRLDKKRKKS